MSNLDLYNKVRIAPPEALKTIGAGRLKGMSDINPMWRLKELTNQFGICGIGWKYTITRQWLEHGGNGEISAFVNIDLFIKVDSAWSDAIPGTGGSSFVANEKAGPHISDECFKMALTDAISVACKALGFAADVYWQGDRTKYDQPESTPKKATQADALKPLVDKPINFLGEVSINDPIPEELTCHDCGAKITKAVETFSVRTFKKPLCRDCQGKLKAQGAK